MVFQPKPDQPWSDEDRATAFRMKREFFSDKAIARKLRRTPSSVMSMFNRAAVFDTMTGAIVRSIKDAPLSPTEEDLDEQAERRVAGQCDSLLEALQKHHPRRAGELVNGPNGFAVVGGKPEKPVLIPATICQHVPESGVMLQPHAIHSGASSSTGWLVA